MIIKSFKIFESNEILYKDVIDTDQIDDLITRSIDIEQRDIDKIFNYIDTSDLKYLFLTKEILSNNSGRKYIHFFGNGHDFRIYKIPDDYYLMFDLNVGNAGYQGNDNLCDSLEGVFQFLKDKII